MWAWGMLSVARGAASMTLETDLTCASATGKDAVCFEWLETCRNKVGIASILFNSFICASEQRTLQLEVASSSGMLGTQSLTLVLDVPADDDREYLGVLHKDVELMWVG